MQAESLGRQMQAAPQGGVTTTTALGQQRRGTRQRTATVAPAIKDRPKTSYSRRNQAAAPSNRSRTSNRSHTSFPADTTLRRSQDSRQNAYTFSQVSALTEHSSAIFPHTHIPTSQGERSLRSGPSGSQGGGGSIPLMPFRQPSLASAGRTAASSMRMTPSQQSFTKSVQFHSSSRSPSFAPPQSELGVPLQRRNPPPAAAANPARTITSTSNAPPLTSTNTQRLMTNLMVHRPMQPPAVFRQPQQQQGGSFRSSSASQASVAASQWKQSGASTAQFSASQFGRSIATHQTQRSQEMDDIKALMKQFEQMVADKTRTMDVKEAEALAQIQEKTSDFAKHWNSRMDDMDSKVGDIDEKAGAFEKSLATADELHEARVRFYSDKSQELDGKVTEVTNIIKTERDSSIKSMKKTYSLMVTKLQDFSTELTNNLHNHPVADMV